MKMEASPSTRNPVLILSLLVGLSAVSTAAIFIRSAQLVGAPSIVIAAARLTIASLILAPLALTRYLSSLQRLGKADWLLALLSGFFLALHFGTWITSLEFTSVASSVVLVTTTPLWVTLLAPVLLREKAPLSTLLGLVIALSGGVIVGMSDACNFQATGLVCPPLKVFSGGNSFLGDFLALFGAWMAAGYILVGRKLRAKIELVPYIFIVYGMSAITLVVFMLATGKSPFGLPPQAYLWFVLLAIVPQLLGHSIFNWTLRFLPASFVSLVLLGEPIGSSVLAYFIFSESPGWMKLFGGILILAGIWLATSMTKSPFP
jgi:drug/metabolite transporter (DMT)-like permease